MCCKTDLWNQAGEVSQKDISEILSLDLTLEKAQFYRLKRKQNKNNSGSSTEGLQGDKTSKAVDKPQSRCCEDLDGGGENEDNDGV